MKSIQQVNSSSVPIGVKQIDTQLQKVKTLLDVEHQLTLERSFKESKLNKEFAQKLTQKVDQLQQERDKYKKQFEEGLKKVEGSGFGRTSFHSNKSDLDRQIQTERGKQPDRSALQQIWNEKGEQMQQEIECLKSENNQVTSDLRQAWQEIDQKEQLTKKLELQNSVLVNEIRKLQRKLQQERLNNTEIKAVKQKDISSSQEQLYSEIQNLRNQINELQDEINEYQEMIDSQQQQIEIQKTNNSQLRIERDNCVHNYAIAKAKLEIIFEEKDEMERQKKIDDESLNSLQACVSIQKENIEVLENEKNCLIHSIDQMKQLINNQEIRINDLKNENINLLEKLAEKPLQINLNLENEIANLQSSQQQDDDWFKKFNNLNDDYQRLNESYINLQTEYGNQKRNIENLEDQIKSEQVINNNLNQENDTLINQIQSLENLNRKLDQQNFELVDQINIYQTKEDKNCNLIQQLYETLDQQNIKNIHLKKQINRNVGNLFFVICKLLKSEKNNLIYQQKLQKQQAIINDLLIALQQKKQEDYNISNIKQQQEKSNDANLFESNQLKNLKMQNLKILGKLFRIIIKQKQKDQQIENLTERITKIKSINEALIIKGENEQEITEEQDDGEGQKKLRGQNNKLLGKLFRVMSQFNKKNKEIEELKERLHKQKAILDELSNSNNAPVLEEKGEDVGQAEEIEINQESQQIPEIAQLKKQKDILFGKLFRAMSLINKKNKEIESLSDRLNKQKAIIEELTSSNSENLAIEIEPQQIELQSAPNNLIEDNGNLELINTEQINKLKTTNDKSLSKLFRAMFLISKKNNQIDELNSRLLKQKAIIEELSQNDNAQQQRDKIHKLWGKLFRVISDLNVKQKQNEELQERLQKSKAIVESLLNKVPEKEEVIVSEMKQSDQNEITGQTDIIQRLEADQQQLKNRNVKLTSKMFRIMIKLSQKDKVIESLSERLHKQKAINDELQNQIVNTIQAQPESESKEIVVQEQVINPENFNKIKHSINKSYAKIFSLLFKLNQKDKIIDELNQRIVKLKSIISEYALNDDSLKKLKDKNHKLLAQQFKVVIKLAKQQQEIEELKNRLIKSKQLVVEQQHIVENLQQQLQNNVILNQEQDAPKESTLEQQGIDLSSKDEEIQRLIRQKNKQMGKLFKVMIQFERKNKEIEQLSQRLLKQKAINDELLLQNSSDETEVSSQSQQKNEPEQEIVQNNQEMKELQEENDHLKQDLKKQTNQNNRWLAKLFRALNCIKSKNSLVESLNQKLAKQKAINEELREQIKKNEEQVVNVEVKENSEQQVESAPASQDDGEGQKKLRGQNNKLLGKLFRVMSQFNKKNKEIEELKERLHKQKAILDELSNSNNAPVLEEKGEDVGQAEEIEINQESQQIPEIAQLKKQKDILFGKLFRAMSLINKKNKEIESLSDRLNKQKAIIEELTSSNSENLAIEIEPQQIELQSAPNNLIEDNGNLELINTEQINKLKTTNDKSLSKLFRAMFLISKKNNQIDELNSRLLKQKAIIEELSQNDNAQQQRDKIHKLWGKLFRVISDLNVKQKQNEELQERLQKSKAIVESLLNKVPEKEEVIVSEMKQSDQNEITGQTDIIQRLEADQQQLKNRNVKLTSKMFRIMIKLSQKDKVIESLSERLHKQKAINDELQNQIVNTIQAQPESESKEIVVQEQVINPENFNKIKHSINKSYAKIFSLLFKLNQKDKIIDELNQRIVKLKSIISEYALNDDSLKKLKDKNHKLLAQQFKVVIKLAKQQQEIEELKNRLIKSKQLVVEQQHIVENLQQQLQNNVILNQEQDAPKESTLEQQGIDLSSKDEEIQRLIRQKNKQMGKLFKVMIQFERKNKEIEQLSQRLLKQKAINDELLLQNSSDETEVSSQSQQKNEPEQEIVQNNQEMKELQEENDHLKQDLKKQTNQNNRWLAKLFRALNCIKSKNSLVESLNQKLAKQKAINEELREQIKKNEEQVVNVEVKENSEQQVESAPASQDDGEGQKKLRGQNNKLLGKLFRVMSQFNKKNKEIEELKERLHKQKAILDELSNSNNAPVLEEKGEDVGQAEEIEINQESQQIPEIAQLKKQKDILFGKLFRAMSLINKKNKEIESLSDRLNKQKAIIEELTSSNSENLAIEIEPQQIELQSAPNNLIEDNGNLELINTEQINKLKTTNDKSLSKLFRAMFLISKKNNQIDELNSRLLKQKAIIEELSQNDNAQQQRDKIHKLWGKLFRVISDLNVKQKQNEELQERLQKSKAIVESLLNKVPEKEEVIVSEMKQSDQNEITGQTDIIQRLEADQQQLKNRNVKLTSKMFRIMIKLSQKDKVIESLSERLHKQKAINDELQNQIVNTIQAQPESESKEIVVQEQVINPENFNKIKHSINKSYAKIFSLLFKLNQKDKIIDELNQRIVKLKSIISEYALNDDSLKKLKDKNHKLLAQQFKVVIKLAKQQQEIEELKNRLIKSKQLVVEQQHIVENLQQQLQNNVILNQEQDAPKESTLEQQGIDLSSKDEEIQRLIRQKNKQMGKLFKVMIQFERKNKEIEQLSQRLLKQKAINDELLLQNSSDETEVSSQSQQKNEPEQEIVQNNQEMKELQEENDHLKQDLKKQTNQNNRWLAKLFRALNCIKSKNSLVESLNQKLAKQKAINEELREQIKKNEEQVVNVEVKENSEQQVESAPASQDDGEGQKKLRGQNNKLLGKLFRVMSQFNKKNKEIEELKERLHKQKAILDELSNSNNAPVLEEKGEDVGQAEEIEINQESQQIPEIAQLKKQKDILFGKLFRAMSLINKKNKEIESLSDRLNKQKAIIEELTSSNSENLAIEIEPQQIEQPHYISSFQKENDILSFENLQLKQQYETLLTKYDTLEQKFNEKIVQFQTLIESLLKQNQDDIEENLQLSQLTKASNKVIKLLHQKQQDQSFENTSSSSSIISIQDESQNQIIYLQHQVTYLQSMVQEYGDGICHLNRRIQELYNKNTKLESLFKQNNCKKCSNL
ncbi:unnamed protein product [Paramecium octaurelia]|uniref:Uncharacterized protein n=1 Tax=Paramecium octaurelia TaxID=43137 RepID=A0A8S1WCW3_PAROT|nr:unnamed protein product [Paramecium octaurelia]